MSSPAAPTPRTTSRRTRRDRGAVIPLVALFMSVLMVGTAFSVDLGRLRTARRDLQADADFLALDAASVLDGLTVDQAMPYVVNEANASAARNQYAFEPIGPERIELGWWEDNVFTPMSGSQVPNAVRLTLTDSVAMFFDMSADERSVTRTAIGVDDFLPECIPVAPLVECPQDTGLREPASRAVVGSVLASIDFYQQPSVDAAFNAAVEHQMTFMNHIYSEFLNINVPGGVDLGAGLAGDPDPVTGPATGLRLDAVSWKGLAAGQVDIEDVAEELRVRGVLATGTMDELIGSTIGAGDLLSAAATVLSNSPRSVDVEASTILASIAAAVDSTLAITVGEYLEASSGREGALETIINADDLLLGTVSIINGRNFVAAEFPINLPGEDGPTTITPRISVIEAPTTHQGYRTAGQNGPSTSQIKIAVEIPVSNLQIDLTLLDATTGVVTRTGQIPLLIEVAKAESLYEAMACPTESQVSFTDLLVETGAVAISFGTVGDAALTSTGAAGPLTARPFVNGSVSILGINVDLAAFTNVTFQQTWQEGVARNGNININSTLLDAAETLRHTAPYGDDGSEWLRYPGIGSNLVNETFQDVPFNEDTLSSSLLSLLPNAGADLTTAIKDAYGPIMDELDEILIDPLLQTMGLSLAGADGRIKNVRCKGTHLV